MWSRKKSELLAKYKVEEEQLAPHTGTRSHYREIAGILQIMQRIKGGKEVVNSILADWRETYRRRPAMWDEFSKKKGRLITCFFVLVRILNEIQYH